MQTKKIIVCKGTSYVPANITTNSIVDFAKHMGWKCDVFSNADILNRYLYQIASPERNYPLPANVRQIFADGSSVVRTIDPQYSIMYYDSRDFNEETYAKKWLESQCRFFKTFEIEDELKSFIESYNGDYRDEIVRIAKDWLNNK